MLKTTSILNIFSSSNPEPVTFSDVEGKNFNLANKSRGFKLSSRWPAQKRARGCSDVADISLNGCEDCEYVSLSRFALASAFAYRLRRCQFSSFDSDSCIDPHLLSFILALHFPIMSIQSSFAF